MVEVGRRPDGRSDEELEQMIHAALTDGCSHAQVVEMLEAVAGIEPRRARDLVGRARLARSKRSRAPRSAPTRSVFTAAELDAMRAELAALASHAVRSEQQRRSRHQALLALGGLGLFVGGGVLAFGVCAGLSILLGKAFGWVGLTGVVVSLAEKLVAGALGLAAGALVKEVGSVAFFAGVLIGYGTYVYWILNRLA